MRRQLNRVAFFVNELGGAMRSVGRGRVAAAVMSVMVGVGLLCGLRPALAAHATTPLVHDPGFSGSCATGGSGTASASTVNVQRTGSELVATVNLVGAEPNVTYSVAVLQAGGCANGSDATISTDNNGIGSAEVQKPVVSSPGTDTVIVDIVGGPAVPVSSGGATASPDEYRSASLKV